MCFGRSSAAEQPVVGWRCASQALLQLHLKSRLRRLSSRLEISDNMLVCRGLRTALLERDDFASGTSSKSTKLVHGGVRYLEKAVFNFDTVQLKLVFEALHERKRLLQNAAHLSDSLPIMTVRLASWVETVRWTSFICQPSPAFTMV